MIKENKKIKKNGGAAMITSVIFFIFISMAIISGLVGPSIREFRIASESLNSKRAYSLAESGVEDAFYRILTNKPITAEETITIDNDSVETSIVSDNNSRQIFSTGDVLNYQRKLNLFLTAGVGVSFSYGVQAGQGGFIMDNNSAVNGSVYSNGTITGSGQITGTAVSANSPALTADQTNGSGTPSYDVTFGNTNGTQDFAQSFQVSTTTEVNKVDLYVKKVNNPSSSLTVKIVSNSGGSPSTNILASSNSILGISPNYGWVSVPLNSHPELVVGTTYWMVVDCSSANSTHHYKIGANYNGYSNGTAKIGRYTSTWNATNSLDGYFKLYLGGITGLINGIDIGSNGVGDAYAHEVKNSSIVGGNFCQIGSGNNKSCDTSKPDPTQVPMPISDQNILDWKSEAETGGTHSGNYILNDDTGSLGPKKITGNLSIENNATFTVEGTLWVTGNMIVDNNATVSLSPVYGSSEGVIIVDGTVSIGNNSVFNGSGTAGSYLMVLSTSTSTSAITLSNNGGAVILYAANGTVNLANNADAKSLNGKFIHLYNNAQVTYDSGLANANFVNGPSGGWEIGSWKETE